MMEDRKTIKRARGRERKGERKPDKGRRKMSGKYRGRYNICGIYREKGRG